MNHNTCCTSYQKWWHNLSPIKLLNHPLCWENGSEKKGPYIQTREQGIMVHIQTRVKLWWSVAKNKAVPGCKRMALWPLCLYIAEVWFVSDLRGPPDRARVGEICKFWNRTLWNLDKKFSLQSLFLFVPQENLTTKQDWLIHPHFAYQPYRHWNGTFSTQAKQNEF